MDTNTYEYQSYTIVRRRMKDRGSFCARLQRRDEAGAMKLHVSVTSRRRYRLKRFFACVHAGPFALPAPCPDQNNG
jgi:hypothetical protein